MPQKFELILTYTYKALPSYDMDKWANQFTLPISMFMYKISLLLKEGNLKSGYFRDKPVGALSPSLTQGLPCFTFHCTYHQMT